MNRSKSSGAFEALAATVAAVVAIALVLLLIVGAWAGIASFSRHQKVSNAQNQIKVTHAKIQVAGQQADVVHAQNARTQALAEQRVIAAKGVAEAQKIINKTITPLYVELEAVDAQKAIATSGRNNTVIYVPAGTNGTPVITQGASASRSSTTP